MAIMGIIWAGLMGCSGTTIHKGIELGNPDPTPATVRITPQGGMTTYDVTFLEKGIASITRTDTKSQLQSKAVVSYQRVGELAVIQADFPGPEHFQASLTLDAEGAVVAVDLEINGQGVPAAFETFPVVFPAVEDDSGETKSDAASYPGIPTGGDQIGPQGGDSEQAADSDQPVLDELAQ